MHSRIKLLIGLCVLATSIGGLMIGHALFDGGGRPKVIATGTALVGGPFSLTATDGTTVSDQTYRGKWRVMYFGYTYCPDACPVALTTLSTALEKLGPDANKLQAIFVTIDPQRDTPEILTEYLKSFDNRIVGLTGTQAQIDGVVKEFRVYVAPQKTGGNDYLVDHSAYFFMMDQQGEFIDVLAPELSGEQIAQRLRKGDAQLERVGNRHEISNTRCRSCWLSAARVL
jgi:protein SCO1